MSKLVFFILGCLVLFLTASVTKAIFTTTSSNLNNVVSASTAFPTENISPTPSQIATHIVISEVQTATSGATTSDFIELYNPTASAINLNNVRLVKRTSSGTTDTQIKGFSSTDIIPAHGYYLWANSTNGYSTQLHSDVSSTDTLADNNSIALRNGALDTGTIIDAVGWGTLTGNPLGEGTAFSPNPTAGKSLERKAQSTSTITSMGISGVDEFKGNGFDSNNNSIDFILRNLSQPQNSISATEGF